MSKEIAVKKNAVKKSLPLTGKKLKDKRSEKVMENDIGIRTTGNSNQPYTKTIFHDDLKKVAKICNQIRNLGSTDLLAVLLYCIAEIQNNNAGLEEKKYWSKIQQKINKDLESSDQKYLLYLEKLHNF